ncbi:MAG TPA: hypothetical protein VGK56_02300 [Anaerolineales bacterium]
MLTALKSIPIFGRAIGFVTGKFRLVIEYALIAAVVTLCAVAVSLWGAKKTTEVTLAKTETRLSVTESRVTTLEGLNQAHEATIADLKNLRGKDAAALDGLLKDYISLAESDSRVRKRLNTLESTNENVRDLLRQPVPPELDCLLRDTCATGDQGSNEDREAPAGEQPTRRM